MTEELLGGNCPGLLDSPNRVTLLSEGTRSDVGPSRTGSGS
jgi:hypothetical protein